MESPSPRGVVCSLNFLDCVSSETQNNNGKRMSKHTGVQREMRVLYNQPHLVQPMKLTVYDQIPASPLPRQSTSFVHWMSQSRDVVSRASTRTSVTPRRKLVKRSLISKPQPAQSPSELPFRCTPAFRPLQLSLYESRKRLSDLPAFDRLSFTENGEIKFPPRALVRTQSEDLLRTRSMEASSEMPRKPASMYEQPQSKIFNRSRGTTVSSVYSTSRPPSEYDALHSHPVSWYDLPGLPQQVPMAAPSQIRKALTPMEEEFSPLPSASVEIDGTTLTFPEVQARRTLTGRSHSYLLPPAPSQDDEGAAPSPVIDPGPNRRATVTMHKSQPSQVASVKQLSVITDYSSEEMPVPPPAVLKPENNQSPAAEVENNTRISQWLEDEKFSTHNRSQDSSISTIKTNESSSTTASFAEHRRKRHQFYALNTNLERRPHTADGSPISAGSRVPTPLHLQRVFPSGIVIDHVPVRSSSKSFRPQRLHERTNTDSTVASTIETDMLFDDNEEDTIPHRVAIAANDDVYSMTTYSCPNSRTGTVKSCASKTAVAPISPTYIDIETIIVPQTKTATGVVRPLPRPISFDFVHEQNTTVMSPRSQAADVEKLMHELCNQAGYRRVNVGMAF